MVCCFLVLYLQLEITDVPNCTKVFYGFYVEDKIFPVPSFTFNVLSRSLVPSVNTLYLKDGYQPLEVIFSIPHIIKLIIKLY